MDSSLIINMIKESFDGFDSQVQKALELVTTAPDSNVTMNTFSNNIYDVVLPVAFSLAVLYFFMSFFKYHPHHCALKFRKLFLCLIKSSDSALKINNPIY